MGYEMPTRPQFLVEALQGLAFWIGHRHAMFSEYPLPEGALVAEACNLIQANLDSTRKLRPEIQYRHLVPEGTEIRGVGNRARADLVVLSTEGVHLPRNANIAAHVQFVFEVKRSAAPWSEIRSDLLRLHDFLEACDSRARGFLIVVAEGRAPKRFVEKGVSRLGSQPIPGRPGCYHVRRTVKAAASFANQSSAHYVCLLEVFRRRPAKLPSI